MILTKITQLLYSFVLREWENAPLRLLMDVFLIGFMLYVVLRNSYRISKKPAKLTEKVCSFKNDENNQKEIDQLCAEWEPEPLVPINDDCQPFEVPIVESASSKEIIVNKKKVLNFGTYNFLGFAGDKDIQVSIDYKY